MLKGNAVQYYRQIKKVPFVYGLLGPSASRILLSLVDIKGKLTISFPPRLTRIDIQPLPRLSQSNCIQLPCGSAGFSFR